MKPQDRARSLRPFVEKASASLTDTDALQSVELFPHWKIDSVYSFDDRVSYNEILYKCLIEHTSQSTWTPDVSPSLWVRIDDPAIEFPDWIQPTGATDAYMQGDKVSHNNKHWISDYNNNTWEPGVYGWSEVQ